MSDTLQLSDNAMRKLQSMDIKAPGFLRLWVAPGGCSGLTYQAAVDETSTPFDRVLYDGNGLRIVTDAESEEYFKGVYLDYSDDLVKAGFRFHNPNALKSCGCGSSFQA